MKTVIVADDLTGACDTAVKMCRDGYSVHVYLNGPITEINEPGIAVNTDSRSLSPTEAYDRLYSLGIGLKDREQIRIYKKIDSLFRGNVMREIDALLNVLDTPCALINAAVPDNHRQIRDGKIVSPDGALHGMDILENVFFGKEETCAGISLATIRRGSAYLADEISKRILEGKRYLIADSETNADLAITAEAAMQCADRLLPVGAAGFLVPFIDTENRQCVPETSIPDPARQKAPLLYVLGTANAVTVDQIRAMKEREGVPTIMIRAEEILQGHKEEETERGIRAAEEMMRTDPEVILLTVSDLEATDNSPGFGGVAEIGDIADCCTDIAASLMGKFHFRGMVVSGGSTAQSLLEKMEVRCIRVQSEYAPGVAVAMIGNGPHEGLRIATKSGGFGERETLYELKSFF